MEEIRARGQRRRVPMCAWAGVGKAVSMPEGENCLAHEMEVV